MIQKYADQIFTFLLIAFMLSLTSVVVFENQITLWFTGITGCLYGIFAFYQLTLGVSRERKKLLEEFNKLKNE